MRFSSALLAAAVPFLLASSSASPARADTFSVESLLHPQDWLAQPAPPAPPSHSMRFKEEDKAGGAPEATGVESRFSQDGTGSGAASGSADGDVSSDASSDASSDGGDASSGAASGSGDVPEASSAASTVDAEKTRETRGPLGRRTQENRGAVTYASGKRMVVPVIAETNSDKPVGVVPPQITSEKPAVVSTSGAPPDPHGCQADSQDAACDPSRFSHVPHTVDALQALPPSVAATQHAGEDDAATEERRKLEDGHYAPHPDNFNLENALQHPERLTSPHAPVPETADGLVQEARAEVLGKVTSPEDRAALERIGVPAAAAAAEEESEAQEQERRQAALLGQQRAADSEASAAESGLHAELASQLSGFERDRRALRMQIADTRRALADLSAPESGLAVDPHMDVDAPLGDIADPADPITGAPNPALREMTAGQRHRRVVATAEALRDSLAASRQARLAGEATRPATAADKALADDAVPEGSPAWLRAHAARERAKDAMVHPMAAAFRRGTAASGGEAREEMDADLSGTGARGAEAMKAAERGVPGARSTMVDELAQLAVKRLETPEKDEAQTASLELEMELVALDLKKSLEKVEAREEKLKERVSGSELAEDEELHRLVTKLADLHHMHKSLTGAAKQQMLAQIAETIVSIKQLFPTPATLVEHAEKAAPTPAAAAAQLPPINPATHFEPKYVDSLCAAAAAAAGSCVPPSLVSVTSSASSAQHVRATPECFSRFQECSAARTECAAKCAEPAQEECHAACAQTHEECRSPCKVEADEVVRDQCGRCHVVEDKSACEREACKAAPVTVAPGEAKPADGQPAAHDGKEELPPALTEQLLATFLKDQMKFNREVMKQIQQIKEGKSSGDAKAALDAADTPAPPAAEKAKPAAVAEESGQEEEEEQQQKHEAETDGKIDHLLRFADARVGDSVPAVHTVPTPKVHAHHTRPMQALKAHRVGGGDAEVDHLEGLLDQIKSDQA